MSENKFGWCKTDKKTRELETELKREVGISYASTQFDLNTEDKAEVQDFISRFIDIEDLHEYGIEKQSHITIVYGIHDQLATNVAKAVQDVKPVTVALGKTSIFDKSEEFDVVKVDVISGDLRKLNKLILNSGIEITNDYPVYVPHLTLGYVLKGEGYKYADNPTLRIK